MTIPDDQNRHAGILATVRSNLYTRQAPKRATTQTAHVLERKYDGNRQAMAAAYGVTSTTVGRWLKGTRKPRGEDAERLQHDATEVQTTPRGREMRARQAERSGAGSNATVSRATTFSVRGSDAIRTQDVPIRLSADQIAALHRTESDAEAHQIVADAVADYFNRGAAYARWSGDDFDFNPEAFTLG